MDHIGIGPGSRDSQVCVRNRAGEIVEEAAQPTTYRGSPVWSRPVSASLRQGSHGIRVGREARLARFLQLFKLCIFVRA